MRVLGARGASALGVWLLAVVPIAVPPVHAEPLSLLAVTTIQFDVAPPARPDSAGLDEDHLVAAPPAPAPKTTWLSLTGSMSDRGAMDLRALLERGERMRLVRLGAVADSRPLRARMTVFGEVPYVADISPAGIPGRGDTYEPASIGVKAEGGGFEIGAVYRSVGSRPERFARAAYRRGPEVWVAQRAGPLRVRVSRSSSWDYVDRQPDLARTSEDQMSVRAELALPSLPFVSLSYTTGESERETLATDPLADTYEQHAFERVTGAVTYGGERWHIAASTSVSQTRDAVRPDGDTVTMAHALGLWLRPVEPLVVAPSVSFRQMREEWSAVHGDAGALSLGLVYAPRQSRWFAATTLYYTSARTSDGAVDAQTLGAHGWIGCRLGRRFRTTSTLAVETGYGRYLDAVSPAASSAVVWVSVNLKLAAF